MAFPSDHLYVVSPKNQGRASGRGMMMNIRVLLVVLMTSPALGEQAPACPYDQQTRAMVAGVVASFGADTPSDQPQFEGLALAYVLFFTAIFPLHVADTLQFSPHRCDNYL